MLSAAHTDLLAQVVAIRESRIVPDGNDALVQGAVKGQALDLCEELFLADGARSEEEDGVLQNLRKLLE